VCRLGGVRASPARKEMRSDRAFLLFFEDLRLKKWLKPTLETGFDCLMCAEFARQRKGLSDPPRGGSAPALPRKALQGSVKSQFIEEFWGVLAKR